MDSHIIFILVDIDSHFPLTFFVRKHAHNRYLRSPVQLPKKETRIKEKDPIVSQRTKQTKLNVFFLSFVKYSCLREMSINSNNKGFKTFKPMPFKLQSIQFNLGLHSHQIHN